MSVVAFLTACLLAGDAPRALDPRGLQNLIAFTRLLGYVQYFHPSDEAAATDWNEFAVEGVRVVEPQPDNDHLVATLRTLFVGVAPTVQILRAGEQPALAAELERPPGPDALVTYWRHFGLGSSNPQSIYKSERIRASAAAGSWPSGARRADDPFRAELIAGVTCVVPLTLYVRDGKTLPARAGSAPARLTSLADYSGNDRATRLAITALAWNIFEHFYPYFDVVSTDWPAMLGQSLRSAAADPDERAYLNTLRRLVAALHDGHGNAYHASEPVLHRANFCWDWVEDRLLITSAPAALGVTPGDAVLEIDGRPLQDQLAACEELISGATPGWIRWKALHQFLGQGPAGTAVTLKLERPTGESYSATLARTQQQPMKEPLPDKIAELSPGIFYVDLDRVTNDDFESAVPDLAKASALIFDLRGYPSKISPETFFPHLAEQPLASAQWHVPVITYPDHQQVEFERGGEWDLRPRAPFFPGKKVFLTGGGAISYAESCMGIVEHYKLAAIVGSPSAGTNGNIDVMMLPARYSVIWTGMKVLKQDGTQHHGIGIRPTVPVARTRDGVQRGVDEVLEKALEIVEG